MKNRKEQYKTEAWRKSIIPYLADMLSIHEDVLYDSDFVVNSEIDENGIVKHYTIEFADGSAEEIENYIDLEDGFKITLEKWFFESPYNYYDKDEYQSLITANDLLDKFHLEIENLQSLMKIEIKDDSLSDILNKQIFIGIIGIMESYLAELFIKSVFGNDQYFRNFVETHPEFAKQKFELRQIFNKSEGLKEKSKKIILDQIYHNLPTVSRMFEDTFKISFPSISVVYQYVLKRHDLVHRNGRTKGGQDVKTDVPEINSLMGEVVQFIEQIDEKMNDKTQMSQQ